MDDNKATVWGVGFVCLALCILGFAGKGCVEANYAYKTEAVKQGCTIHNGDPVCK